MKSLLAIAALMLLAAAAQAQRIDFFASDFNIAGAWQQERANFVSGQEGYMTDTSAAYGTDVISRQVAGLAPEDGDISLKFQVKCGFDNSSVNNFQVYLIASGPDPSAPDFRGFAVGTGFKPNYKALSLVYSSGGNIEVLASTGITVGRKAFDVQVSRTSSGVWHINQQLAYAEPSGGFHLSSFLAAAFTCNKTGAQNFGIRFDEFCQRRNPHPQKSAVDSAIVVDSSTIRLFLTARLGSGSYPLADRITLGGIKPVSVDYGFYTADAHFAGGAISPGKALELKARGLVDARGQGIGEYSQEIYQAGPGDIVINEIMVDLSPAPFALPKNKYVELLNTSGKCLRLDGYTFFVGDLEYVLPYIELPPEDYLVLCASDTAFAKYGRFANILQESRLTVAGKSLALASKIGSIVDSLTYTDKMYHDPSRDGGGFSMERRDPYNNCTGTGNWQASADLSGGTPGRRNSQYRIYVDDAAPELVACSAIAPSRFSLTFSEPVRSVEAFLNGSKAAGPAEISGSSAVVGFPAPMRDGQNDLEVSAVDACSTQGQPSTVSIGYAPFRIKSASAISQYQVLLNLSAGAVNASTGCFRLSGGQIPIICEYTSDGNSSLLLSFADDFEAGKKYSLHVDGLCSSLMETISGAEAGFRYSPLMPGDIIINEVMYYPNAGAKRYVELLNASGADVFPFGLQVRFYSADGSVMKQAICTSHQMLAGGDLAVLAADTAAVASYYGASAGSLYECPEMPAFNTSKGYLALVSAAGVTLDSMYYEKSMHSSILQSVRGVALERVSPDAPSLDASSWKSAQRERGFATPGEANSVHAVSGHDLGGDLPLAPSSGEVSMENQLLRPGDAGRQLEITLNISRQDVCFSATIYDDNGRLVRNLATQEMAFPGCVVEWDGTADGGSICRPGMYVAVVKAWDPSGWSSTYKRVCVVGTGR